MLIQLEVLQLSYEVKLHKTISSIIAIANRYEILIYSLRAKRPKQIVAIEEDENRLKGIQGSSKDNLNELLLERQFII